MLILDYYKGDLQKTAYAGGFGLVIIGLLITGRMVIDTSAYPQKFLGLFISYWAASGFLIFFFFNYRKRKLYFRIASIGFLIAISATILEAFNKCNCFKPVLTYGFSNSQVLAIMYASLSIFKKLE